MYKIDGDVKKSENQDVDALSACISLSHGNFLSVDAIQMQNYC